MNPQTLSYYPGPLKLDANANHAWVVLSVGPALLMMDPNQTGAFSWGEVTAAYQYYATLAQQGVTQIHPQGFVPLNGNLVVVHVVKP